MNNCEYYRELVSRMIDDDLAPDESRVLSYHLRTCESCAAVYEAFSGMSNAITQDMVNPPENMLSGIMAAVKEEKKKSKKTGSGASDKYGRRRKKAVVRRVLLTAACVAAAFIGGIYFAGGKFSPADKLFANKAATEAVTEESALYGSAGSGYIDAAAPESAAAEAEAYMIDAEEDKEEVIANVSKIEIMYGDNVRSEFTMYVGDAPLFLTSQMYPLSIKSRASFRSSDDNVLEVEDYGDGTCSVTPIGGGTARVIAYYAGFESGCTVYVIDDTHGASEGIGIYCFGTRIRDFTIGLGDSETILSVDLAEGIEGKIEWEASDDSIVGLSQYGEYGCSVVPKSTGTAYIYVSCGDRICKCTVRVIDRSQS